MPLTAILLLGGARSSEPPRAGLFLSSILVVVEGRGEAEGVVATGIRGEGSSPWSDAHEQVTEDVEDLQSVECKPS